MMDAVQAEMGIGERGRVALTRVTRGIVALWLCFMHWPGVSLAQCAMCRASLANSDDPGRASADVNTGILILLLPTLALIAALTGLVVRYHRADTKSQT